MSNCFIVEVSEDFIGALEVIANKYGIGAERIEKLKEAGYDADRVQEIVNILVEVME